MVSVMADRGGEAYSEGARGVTGGSPASTTVQTHTLIGNNLEKATATEGFGVSLTLNLKNIQREQNDLSNADQTKSSRVRCILAASCSIILTFQQWRA